MSKLLFNHRLSVGVTDKMNDLLQDIAIARTRKGTPISKSDLIREAIRLYLDEQADARGSRKQIAKSLEGQIETLQAQMMQITEQLAFQQQMIVQLGQALQPVIDRVKPRPN
jgi:Arc/MetJ-type ribon-helix-helix transcriptional regulator